MASAKIHAVIFDLAWTLCDWGKKELFPETRSVLEAFFGRYKLAIVALAGDGNIEERFQLIKKCDIEKYFPGSIFIDVRDKDSLYWRAMKKMECVPENVAIVDDRAVRGVKWGNSVGATTVWLNREGGKWSHQTPNEETGQPTYIIRNIGELISLPCFGS